jgi:SAM-dependent methyltransferase
MKGVKEVVPWWLKIGAKIVLARLPIPYALWKRLGLFEHGDMNRPHRALETFLERARMAGVLDSEGGVPRLRTKGNTYTVLELGPGDALFTAVIARALGASKTWLVDAGSFATVDMVPYAELLAYLRQQGLSAVLAGQPQTVIDLLKECSTVYLTGGVHVLAQVPSNSVDYCFSNAVLEHIPKGDFALLAAELSRLMKPDGVSVHRVDLKDHLGGSLNNLRFTGATWEGDLFRKSGFYTNRIRYDEMVALFDRVGFDCHFPRVVRWDALPTPRAKLDKIFRNLPDDDLLVSGFDVVLRRKR